MARPKTTTPAGHGELVTTPAYVAWPALARDAAAVAARWDFAVCGVPVAELRRDARREAVDRARVFSARLGVPVREVGDEPELIVVTGHQPELYHPGVWVKDFLLQRLAEETGGAAIDLVVDSDGFDTVEMHSPCLKPEVRVCRAYLAVGTADGCYAGTPVPPADALDQFCEAGAQHLSTLPSPALGHHFRDFCAHLKASASEARNLAELVTIARRRYEAPAGTDYLELPITSLASSRAFATLVAHLALDASAFAEAYNISLAAYRERTGTRGAAQPFPDLRREGDLVELPLWHLADGARHSVWARTGPAPAIIVDGEAVCELGEIGGAPDAVLASALAPAPKALALTLFARLFIADVFIHGVGGGRYDQVTDDVIRRYFGVEPPPFVVASLTMYLPLGARIVSDTEIEEISMSLNRLKHNPDQMLDEVDFDTVEEHSTAVALAGEKAGLVAAISGPDADRKALGLRIRVVNEELSAMLEPYQRQLSEQLDQLRQLKAAGEILTDRTYPFCYWSPAEVADKAR